MNARSSDGDAAALLASVKHLLEQGLLPVQIFNDRDLHELELKQIFARSWMFIGHESELPKRGDYALRYIGADPFIFIRGKDDVIRVLFNSCRHRGSQVCRSEMGNATHFTCPYHGWTYNNAGELEGVPARREGYRELDFAAWGLLRAPHVARYCGLVFANLDPDAIPLEQYLGSYRWYLDVQLKLTEGGMEVLGEPHRWVVDSNWKQGAENFSGDNSHTAMTHRSALECGIVTPETADALRNSKGFQIHDVDGHVVSIRQLPPGEKVFWLYPPDVTRLFRPGSLTAAQFELAGRGLVHTGTIFPNLSFLHTGLTDSQDRPPNGYLSLRVWQPKGPGKTEIWSWILAPKEAPDSYKERAYRVGMSSFGPAGNFEQDDVTIWPGIARSAASVFARMNGMKLNYQMGLGGMTEIQPVADWPGPGVAVPSNAGEGGLRTFYRTWYDHMVGARP